MENLAALLKSHKLSEADYQHIVQILGREPNLVELGIFSAMWSEHCSYKSSKKYLRGFPTEAEWVIQGPGENAGVIDIGGGYAAVFKMESHNHPSFIEPYQGAATGVGGIMRDVFTMGARPVASLNSIRFGDIRRDDEIGKKHRYLLKGVVAGIGGYGNCMGVPTIGGEMSFEECYNGNILVNAFTLGVAKSDEIFYGRAEGIGNPVIYVGSKTGRDGLGGAVMSSDSFGDEANQLRPTVQVGDPFSEKLLLEACLELFKTDYIVGIQDMGAAGLTSSSFEMAGRSGSGMIIHLDRVPMRESGMTPYELMLSESQERMLICARKGYEERVLEIFHKWEIDAEVIGEVTASGKMELFWHGEKCAEIPVAPVSEEAPILNRSTKEPSYISALRTQCSKPKGDISLQDVFMKLWRAPENLDKAWVYSQYDSMVQTNTIVGAGAGDGSVIRVKENGSALSMSADCNPRYCYLNPREGAKLAVVESGRNVAVRGARPLAITDCLNFGSPENPEVMWQFAEACDGIKEACKSLEMPVVSGNVSLYNQTNGVDIFPTPSIASVGLLKDAQKVLGGAFKNSGNMILLVGDTSVEFGGSLYQKEIENRLCGDTPSVDLKKELALWRFLEEANEAGIFASAKDVNIGGIAIALAKMSVRGAIGCEVASGLSGVNIFSESQSRAIVELDSKNLAKAEELANKWGIALKNIGHVGGDTVKIDGISYPLCELEAVYRGGFEEIVNKL